MKSSWFLKFSNTLAKLAGRASTFVIAVVLVIVWGLSGPLFHFSDTWQLVINTSTTIVTFLMVFLIQNTQNRDTAAMQIKLDEIIRAIDTAHNALLDLEKLDQKELGNFRKRSEKLARRVTTCVRKIGTLTCLHFATIAPEAASADASLKKGREGK
ncbi:Low affinity iron permease [Caballeronia catudaia]|uniref:Low affinity iron permease n=1 Tax=Caballeronia catudaia TaxID=1777136 RepID=A0A158DJS1_9BURK|nr:low affinity iron permease family protein [Caballeronia catudaia]SAK94892.1 Low affinity iron permease [Caballeronia catudaia]